MNPITSILVPTDFGPPSDAALAYAEALAEQFGASLHLLHAYEDPFAATAFAAEAYAPVPPELREAAIRDAEAQLTRRLSDEERAHFRATTQVTVGAPVAAILDAARAQNVDLIVMGTHGRSGFKHFLLGSIAEHVLRAAPCPVLTVHCAATEPATNGTAPGGPGVVPS